MNEARVRDAHCDAQQVIETILEEEGLGTPMLELYEEYIASLQKVQEAEQNLLYAQAYMEMIYSALREQGVEV